MGFSRQEYWSGLPFPSPGDLPDPEMESRSPAVQAPYQLSYKGSLSDIHCVTNYPGGSVSKESACNAGDRGDSGSTPGWRRSPGEGNGNPFQYFLPEKIPWTEEPGGLQSMGSHRVRHG